MKTILLWDPRFPDRRPSRLTVENTVASAAVRAGVAAAANPAEAGALSAGGALDPTMLTEVVLQHGSGSATRRVVLPYSVVMVGAAAGVLASIGTLIPGGVNPTPNPTLTLSSTSPSIASNAAAGTPVSNISNVPASTTPTVTPNDGRLVIAGDSSTGWKVVVGNSALSMGTINFSVAAAGATGASGVLTIAAVAAAFSFAQLPADTVMMDLDPAVASSMTMGTTVGTEVKSWRSVHQGTPAAVTFAQTGADGLAPRLVAGGWDGTLPSVLSDGTNDFLIGDGPYANRQWHFLVAERATTNNVNTQNSKAMFGGAESNGGRYGRIAVVRQTQDTSLTSITFSGLGSSSLSTRGGFTVGKKMTIFYDLGRFNSIDGVTKNACPASDVGTAANTYLFGRGDTDNCMGMKLARIVTVDPTKLHGSYDNAWATTVIAGHLAWKYGTQDALSTTHFFKNRAPLASDLSGFNPAIQTWGNSIGNGTSAGLPNAVIREGVSLAQRGSSVTNGCTGGHTPAQIENAFNNGLNLGQGLTDNLPIALQRDKMTMFGEMFANAPNTGEDGAIVCMQRMVPLVEQAQGVSAGNARLLIWAPWSSWTGDVKSTSRQNTLAQMRALWPNYVYDIEEDFYQLGAPGAPYDDPTNYAAGRPPAALKEANGTLHPNDTGYGELRKLIGAWIVARKWDL
jgi:hypothetical protein